MVLAPEAADARARVVVTPAYNAGKMFVHLILQSEPFLAGNKSLCRRSMLEAVPLVDDVDAFIVSNKETVCPICYRCLKRYEKGQSVDETQSAK